MYCLNDRREYVARDPLRMLVLVLLTSWLHVCVRSMLRLVGVCAACRVSCQFAMELAAEKAEQAAELLAELTKNWKADGVDLDLDGAVAEGSEVEEGEEVEPMCSDDKSYLAASVGAPTSFVPAPSQPPRRKRAASSADMVRRGSLYMTSPRTPPRKLHVEVFDREAPLPSSAPHMWAANVAAPAADVTGAQRLRGPPPPSTAVPSSGPTAPDVSYELGFAYVPSLAGAHAMQVPQQPQQLVPQQLVPQQPVPQQPVPAWFQCVQTQAQTPLVQPSQAQAMQPQS